MSILTLESLFEILNEIRPECEFEKSNNFLEDGILDSFDIIALVTTIEKNYSLLIHGDEITPENFRNIDTIFNFLSQKK